MPDPIESLRDLLATAERGDLTSWGDLHRWREQTLGLLRTLFAEGHERVDRFAGYPTHTSYRRDIPRFYTTVPTEEQELASKSEHLASVLRGLLTELDARQPTGPDLSIEGLHPWIIGAVTGLWNDGHHRQAVDEATRALEIRLKAKLDRDDVTGVPLVTSAFNPDPPRPGEPRLRFPAFEEGSRAWTNAHRGAMHFAQGCMMRIRNLVEHHDDEMLEQVALESLAALSLLARWTDEAEVEAT